MRQKIRKTLLLISFLLFPVTIFYFSPYLIIEAASEHIMNGSFIVFASMFVLSMFLGRVWCGYFCPAGGLQESVFRIKDTPAKLGWRDKIKYVIWIIWMAAICNKACPMGLDVKRMVSEGSNGRCTECIQCGACVDECPKKVLNYMLVWRR